MPKYKVTIAKKDCEFILQSGEVVSRQTHILKNAGSNPASATIINRQGRNGQPSPLEED